MKASCGCEIDIRVAPRNDKLLREVVKKNGDGFAYNERKTCEEHTGHDMETVRKKIYMIKGLMESLAGE